MRRIIFATIILTVCFFTACNLNKSDKDQWLLVWEEDFTLDSLDTNVWSKIPRGNADWNKFMADYDSCYDIKNGNLILKAIPNVHLEDDTAKVLTGGIWSKGKKWFQNGRIEIKAKLDEGQGAWPAIWMLPEGHAWPAGGEIDIMEHLNNDSIVYQTIHSTYTLAEKEGPKSSGTQKIKNSDYNIYALEFYADSLRLFTNDELTLCYPRVDSLGSEQFPFKDNFYILISNQVGGNWVGKYNIDDLPVNMYIDWIRFYRKNSDQ